MGRTAKQERPADIEKFMNLAPDKRDRMINAAMKEFRYGYKKASTDAIVKEAGISKGLLYHYFGSKEQLYVFLIRHATELVHSGFYDMMNKGNQDILDVFWQMALLKKDLTDQYPYLYEFASGAHVHRADAPYIEIERIEKEQEDAYEELYTQCDAGLFRADIDYKKAIDIIAYTLDSLIDGEETKAISEGGWNDAHYEQFLESLRSYLDIFRVCFYKQ